LGTNVYSRTLRKAAELLGGQQALSKHLRVPSSELQKWLEDKDVPPLAIFLQAVDLVVEESTGSSDSTPGDPPSPRDAAPGNSPATRY